MCTPPTYFLELWMETTHNTGCILRIGAGNRMLNQDSSPATPWDPTSTGAMCRFWNASCFTLALTSVPALGSEGEMSRKGTTSSMKRSASMRPRHSCIFCPVLGSTMITAGRTRKSYCSCANELKRSVAGWQVVCPTCSLFPAHLCGTPRYGTTAMKTVAHHIRRCFRK